MQHHSDRHFVWLPNAFTILRLLLVVPIFTAAAHGAWELGFWLALVALASDFADGLAAKKLNAYTALGAWLDPLADFMLAAALVASSIFYGPFPVWAGVVMLVPALYVGYVNFILPPDDKQRITHAVFSVPYLFVVWGAGAAYFAARAYGWHWWYVLVGGVALVVAGYFKRHRLQAWFGWLRQRHDI